MWRGKVAGEAVSLSRREAAAVALTSSPLSEISSAGVVAQTPRDEIVRLLLKSARGRVTLRQALLSASRTIPISDTSQSSLPTSSRSGLAPLSDPDQSRAKSYLLALQRFRNSLRPKGM